MTITTPEWVKDAIFYQIFPDRFAQSGRLSKDGLNLEPWDSPPTYFGFKGGDLLGVVEHLDYLQDLGITALYLNPVFASSANHRYHTYDYYHVDPLLGGNQALRELLDELHRRDMRLVLDGVFNHASRGFWQFHHTLENGASSPYIDWFHINPDYLKKHKYLGAYPTTQQEEALRHGRSSYEALGYTAWWNMPALPKFNTASPAVRQFLFDVAEHWIQFGIDGWRLDVPAEIDDDGFWREFRERVKAANPQAYIVGEIWHEAQRWLGGDQFDGVMNYQVTMAILGFFSGNHLNLEEINKAGGYRGNVVPLDTAAFAERIDHLLGLYDPAINQAQLNLLDSHDTPRWLTCASGERASLELALLFLFSYPGAPCIYYGDEIGLDGSQDPGCRKSFPWEGQADRDHELLSYTKSCVALRKLHPALRRGSYQRLYAADGLYAFGRQLNGETLIVALNASEEGRTVELPAAGLNLPQGPLDLIFGLAEASIQGEQLHLAGLTARRGAVFSNRST